MAASRRALGETVGPSLGAARRKRSDEKGMGAQADDTAVALISRLVEALGPAGPPPQPVLAPVVLEVLNAGGTPRSARLLPTVDEAADEIGIGRIKLYELIKSGDLPAVRVGKRRFVRPEDVAAFVSQLSDQPGRRTDVPA